MQTSRFNDMVFALMVIAGAWFLVFLANFVLQSNINYCSTAAVPVMNVSSNVTVFNVSGYDNRARQEQRQCSAGLSQLALVSLTLSPVIVLWIGLFLLVDSFRNKPKREVKL